jgi:hypothetical protein
MNAKFIGKDTESIKKGDELYVIEVQGNVLICSRDKSKE